jgi:hypothetical protein
VGADQSVRHPILARFFDRFAAKDEERVLCCVPDVDSALADLRRVLRGCASTRLMGGCHPNRDTLAAIERAGFAGVSCRGFKFPPGARFSPVAPRIVGVARR